jgi:hypothetical protein
MVLHKCTTGRIVWFYSTYQPMTGHFKVGLHRSCNGPSFSVFYRSKLAFWFYNAHIFFKSQSFYINVPPVELYDLVVHIGLWPAISRPVFTFPALVFHFPRPMSGHYEASFYRSCINITGPPIYIVHTTYTSRAVYMVHKNPSAHLSI